MNEIALLLLLVCPLIGIFILLVLPVGAKSGIKGVSFASAFLPLLLLLYMAWQYYVGTSFQSFGLSWKWFQFGNFATVDSTLFTVQFELGVDGLSFVLLLLTSLVTVLAAIASFKWISQAGKSYFILFLLLELGMLGVFAAENMLLFFVFFEMTLVSLFFLVGKWGGRMKEQAAFRFLIYNGLGSAVLLIVMMVIFAKTGTDNLAALQQILPHGNSSTIAYMSNPLKYSLLLALLLAFGVKLPIVPLHSWMISVHREAPIPVVMIHSGILLKIGAYGLIRFGLGLFPEQFSQMANAVLAIGLVNLLYGAFLALIQKDVRSVLAYSSVSHMGIVLIGLGALQEAGMQGAVIQVVSHGLISALFFFLAGCLYERTSTLQFTELGGLAKRMPRFSGFLLAAGMASLGLPGTSGFIGEFLSFLGFFHANPIWGAIGTLALILAAVYVLRAVMGITFGREKFRHEGLMKDLGVSEWIPSAILMAAIVGIGVFPSLLLHYAQPAITMIMTGLGG
ncbi:complex I subunit 4 family protein [Bacillus sp. 1P06AnD]|uniref:complex I subunit 4 family protein n=1 Tax=Bacillus sp. 1P06AnD TaxID=3132208 RepID=UPI0039A17D4B